MLKPEDKLELVLSVHCPSLSLSEVVWDFAAFCRENVFMLGCCINKSLGVCEEGQTYSVAILLINKG